jgi:hypothetical protein
MPLARQENATEGTDKQENVRDAGFLADRIVLPLLLILVGINVLSRHFRERKEDKKTEMKFKSLAN